MGQPISFDSRTTPHLVEGLGHVPVKHGRRRDAQVRVTLGVAAIAATPPFRGFFPDGHLDGVARVDELGQARVKPLLIHSFS